VRRGVASQIFYIGQIIETTYGDYTCHWRVIDFDHDHENSMTLEMVEVVPSVQFDAAEAMYYADGAALAAGTYNFTYNGNTYQITTTAELPAGGVICLSIDSNNIPTKANLYSERASTTTLESVTVATGTSGTNLGTCDGTTLNHHQRIRYGSNNYKESAIRQWLNSSAAKGSVWTPQTKYDRPPAWMTSLAGFESLIDPELVAVAMPVTKKVNRNTVTDGGGSDEVTDKFWLLSEREVYMAGSATKLDGDEPYAYYKNYSANTAASNGADTNRLKYSVSNPTASQYYWLRTPSVSYSSHVRVVYRSGALDLNVAYGTGNAAAPACCIY
jgi:hypothetical protein